MQAAFWLTSTCITPIRHSTSTQCYDGLSQLSGAMQEGGHGTCLIVEVKIMGRVLVVARYARYFRDIYLQITRAKFRALAQPRHRNFIHLRQMCSRWVLPDALEMCTVLPKLQLPGPLPDRAHNSSTEGTDTGCHDNLMAGILIICAMKSLELICNESHPNQQPRHPKHYPFIVHQKATLVLPWMGTQLLGIWKDARWKDNSFLCRNPVRVLPRSRHK